jgi:hypothetical protein
MISVKHPADFSLPINGARLILMPGVQMLNVDPPAECVSAATDFLLSGG